MQPSQSLERKSSRGVNDLAAHPPEPKASAGCSSELYGLDSSCHRTDQWSRDLGEFVGVVDKADVTAGDLDYLASYSRGYP
jgi:hypothetical protein